MVQPTGQHCNNDGVTVGNQTRLMKPHRGNTILVLGILGLVVCFVCGIIAWVMGHKDLVEIDAGLMDPTGRDITNAGRICGMIGTILSIVVLGIQLILFLIFIGICLRA